MVLNQYKILSYLNFNLPIFNKLNLACKLTYDIPSSFDFTIIS